MNQIHLSFSSMLCVPLPKDSGLHISQGKGAPGRHSYKSETWSQHACGFLWLSLIFTWGHAVFLLTSGGKYLVCSKFYGFLELMTNLGEHKAANTFNLQADFLMTGCSVHCDFFVLLFLLIHHFISLSEIEFWLTCSIYFANITGHLDKQWQGKTTCK